MTTEPKWSTTLPVEPGWYWCRFDKLWLQPRIIIEDDGVLYQCKGAIDPQELSSLARGRWEWWTAPIEEPPR